MKRIWIVYLDSRDEYCQFFGCYDSEKKANKRIEELEESYSGIDYIWFDINENCEL